MQADLNEILKRPQEDFTSEYYILIALTILESRGFNGLLQLSALLKDSGALINAIRLFAGRTITFPTLTELADSLDASLYAYLKGIKYTRNKSGANCDVGAKADTTGLNNKEIDALLNITEDKKQRLEKILDLWAIHLKKEGYKIEDYFTPKQPALYRRLRLATVINSEFDKNNWLHVKQLKEKPWLKS